MRKILFVRVHNSGRSQMAEAFFNNMAKDGSKASSAGTEPAQTVNETVVQAMGEIGIDISRNKPKKMTLEMVERADKVITMGCGIAETCPATFVETEDWELADPQGMPLEEIRKIRDEIKERVHKLIDE